MLNLPIQNYRVLKKDIGHLDNEIFLQVTQPMGYIMFSTPQDHRLIYLDIEVADMLYSAYALDQSDYGALVSGVSEYEVPFIDMFLFIYDQKESGNITLDDDLEETLTDAYSQICIVYLPVRRSAGTVGCNDSG